MRTVSIFINGRNQAVRIPADMAYQDVTELEIRRDGDVITLRPARPSWNSFSQLPPADPDYLKTRPDILADEGRFVL